jgi:hypothetical protein
MKVIAVVGSASGSGKTGVACAILRAVPGLGAVKISPREGPARVERGPGLPGKDTARYAECGAAAVARVVAPRERVREAWGSLARDFERLPAVVVEGAGALELPGRRLTIFVAAPATLGERPERDERLAADADWIVVVRPSDAAIGEEQPLIALRRGRARVLEVSLDEVEWTAPALIEAVRVFLLDKKEAEDSIPLAPPAPAAAPPSPKGDSGGLISLSRESEDD